jgi:hypothetical protein
VLEVLEKKEGGIYDKKFGFKMSYIHWFQQEDPVFYLQVMKILKKQVNY